LTQSQTEQAGPRGRVAWKSSMVALLRVLQVVALLTALVYWFGINANRDEANRRRLADLQSDVSAQISELRQIVSTGLGDMRLQLAALPDTRSRLDQAGKQIASLDARHTELDTRTTTLEQELVDLRGELTAITRTSNAPLPGTRR
jgi:chromosome segregation ATPase